MLRHLCHRSVWHTMPLLNSALIVGFIVNLKKLVPAHPGVAPSGSFDRDAPRVCTARASQNWCIVKCIVNAMQELHSQTQAYAHHFMQVTELISSCYALVPLCLFQLHPVTTMTGDSISWPSWSFGTLQCSKLPWNMGRYPRISLGLFLFIHLIPDERYVHLWGGGPILVKGPRSSDHSLY